MPSIIMPPKDNHKGLTALLPTAVLLIKQSLFNILLELELDYIPEDENFNTFFYFTSAHNYVTRNAIIL